MEKIYMEKTYLKARKFIEKKGTATQITCFNYLIGEGQKENVIVELYRYQNNDGGWACGLEAEYQGELSSVLTTAAALSYIYLFGLDDTKLMDKTLSYLIERQNEAGYWDEKDEIRQFDIPPYYQPGTYLAYKTGMLLKWLRRLEVDQEMVAAGYQYLLNTFQENKKQADMWTAIAYINAFAEYPHSKSKEIMDWAVNTLNEIHGNNNVGEELPWMQVQGMIYDDNKMLLNSKDKALEAIKENQLDNGAWPHQFGVYNQVWAAILIIRFLKMIEGIKI